MKNKTEIIAFFSSEGFFRLKTDTKQAECFQRLKPNFEQEFGEPLHDELFDFLLQYQNEQRRTRKEREKKRLLAKNNLPIATGATSHSDHIKNLPAGKYVLTSAQNNTHVNKVMLNCLLQFCEANGAKLLIGRLTYNKSGFQQPDIEADGLWYDKDIKPYLVQGHINLQGAHFLADSNIIPTAKNPLSGFSGSTEPGQHIILPHTKIALQVDAALKGSATKIITSTGAITLQNYIMRKAGSTAAIEHCIGAVFVDTTSEKDIKIRHVELMPESEYFYDLDMMYTQKNAIQVTNNLYALQPGDIHAEKMEEKNLENLVSLIQKCYPYNLILHDICDFSSRNHHNKKDCTFIHLQHLQGNTVKNDLTKVVTIIEKLHAVMRYGSAIYIVESNHDLALTRWLLEEDFKTDPVNAVTYLTCMLGLYTYQASGGKPSEFNMLEYACKHVVGRDFTDDNIYFNQTDQSLMIAGIEMGNHGHNGINGSCGSPQQFRRLGIAMNTGHSHSPQICGKVYTAGVTASLDMGYNRGASSWSIAHIFTYENGQRQLIFC